MIVIALINDIGLDNEATMANISVGDFILVVYTTKKLRSYFTGHVLDKNDDDNTVEVKYLTQVPQSKSTRFVYPDKDDIDSVSIEDIIMKLPVPLHAGGTKRASKQYIFDVDLSTYF